MNQRKRYLIKILIKKLIDADQELFQWFLYDRPFLTQEKVEKPVRTQEEILKEDTFITKRLGELLFSL